MNQELYAIVQEYICRGWPGCIAVEVVIKMNNNQKVKLPIPAPTIRVSVIDADAFVPNAAQTAILTALDGKAMNSSALAAIVGDKRRVYAKPGGIQELREKGLVEHHERLGYYRPDAPPDEIQA